MIALLPVVRTVRIATFCIFWPLLKGDPVTPAFPSLLAIQSTPSLQIYTTCRIKRKSSLFPQVFLAPSSLFTFSACLFWHLTFNHVFAGCFLSQHPVSLTRWVPLQRHKACCFLYLSPLLSGYSRHFYNAAGFTPTSPLIIRACSLNFIGRMTHVVSKSPALSLMFLCRCLEILNFWRRGPIFSFCTGLLVLLIVTRGKWEHGWEDPKKSILWKYAPLPANHHGQCCADDSLLLVPLKLSRVQMPYLSHLLPDCSSSKVWSLPWQFH